MISDYDDDDNDDDVHHGGVIIIADVLIRIFGVSEMDPSQR